MITILIALLILFTCFLSRLLFKSLFNHLSIYAVTWGGMILLYEFRLLPYRDLSFYTWMVILSAFLSFLLGSVSVFAARSIYNVAETEVTKEAFFPDIFADEGKSLKLFVYLFGFIALFSAIQTWYVLIKEFGGFTDIFLAASKIYSLRNEGELEGPLPYIYSFSLPGIFYAGIYTAYNNKVTFATILPLFASLLREIAIFSRVGILIAFVGFFVSFFLYRGFLHYRLEKRYKKKMYLVTITVLVIMMIVSATVVKEFRGTYEDFKGESKELRTIKEGLVFSPSIYLYLSSNIGVLNAYLVQEKEVASFGENSLAPFYNLLSKFELAQRVPYNAKGYYIPMWTNAGTYLRGLHADYGIAGIFIIPYLLGLLSSFFWVKFYKDGNLIYFVGLVHLYIIISISFFSIATRGAIWFISILVLLITVPLLRKRISFRQIEK